MRVGFVDDVDSVSFADEGDEIDVRKTQHWPKRWCIPRNWPCLVSLSNSSSQIGTPEQLAASISRSMMFALDSAFSARPHPPPRSRTGPRLANWPGVSKVTAVAANLDKLITLESTCAPHWPSLPAGSSAPTYGPPCRTMDADARH